MGKSKFTRCFLSEMGYNNFWYPTSTVALIPSHCEYKELAWISGDSSRDLTPIKILKSCVLPLKFNQTGAKNLAPPENDTYIVVWIDK